MILEFGVEMGGNKKPRKKKVHSGDKADKVSQVKAAKQGRTLMYIIAVMSVVGAGAIVYFVS